MNRNNTDYDFPPDWGLYTDEEKHDWFVRERVFRQATRQDTAFGRRYRESREKDKQDTEDKETDIDYIPISEATDFHRSLE